MAKEEAKKKQEKRSTAEKRHLQSEKKRLLNGMFKSKIKTATKKFDLCAKEKNQEALTKELANVYSLLDKAVKRNIYASNKVNRLKARYAKASKVSAPSN